MALLRKIGRSRLVKLPDGRKQVIDRFEVRSDAGDPANLSTVFLAWGTAHEKYTDCLLVQQPNLDFSGDQRVEQDLVRVYEELPLANASPNEVQAGGDTISKDADGRYSLSRQAIQLAAATLTEGAIGSTVTVGASTYALSGITHSSDGAVRTVQRTYIEATASEVQVGGDEIGKNDNNRRTVTRRYIQLTSAAYVEGTIGGTITVSTVTHALNSESKSENGTVRSIARQYIEATTAEVQVGGDVTGIDDNGRRTITRRFVQLASAAYVEGTIGAALTVSTVDYGLNDEAKQQDATVRTITRRWVQASTTLTQVGGEVVTTDADGRKRVSATFIQLIAGSTYTPGVVGTTSAPTTSNCVLSGEQVTENATLRTVQRSYTQVPATAATAEAVGPIVVTYPFNHLGDATHVIASQEFEQLASYYAPLALGATSSVLVGNASQTLYYIGDVVTSRQGATLVRFKRQYANKPAARDEYETFAATFPGIGASQAEFEADLKVKIRNGFTRIVLSKLTYTYFRIAASGGDATSPTDISLDTVQTYTKSGALDTQMSPAQVYLSDVDTLALIALGGAILTRLLTVPTRTQYFALGSYGLILQSTLQRYKGNFYVRITRRVTAI